MDGLTLSTGMLSYGPYLLIGRDAYLCKGQRKAYLLEEVLNLSELLLRCPLKYQLYQCSKGHAVAMGSAVSSKGRKTIIEGMGHCKSSVVRTNS